MTAQLTNLSRKGFEARIKSGMRINKLNTNAAFMPPGPDKNPARYVRGGAVLTVKLPGTALPNTISFKSLPVYQPERHDPVRPGADDHLRYKSRGFQT